MNRSNNTKNTNGSCLARIRAQLTNESKSMSRIARFILESPTDARSTSIDQLGRACGSSTATVSRFCKILGYTGYKEFQLDLAAAVAQSDVVMLDDFSEDIPPKAIIHRVFECNRQSLVDTEKVLDHDVLVKVARLILRARRVVFLGVGESARVGHSGAQRFTTLGLTAIASADPFDQIFASHNARRGDVVIGISHTGQTASVIEGIRAARRRGARTVAITNYPQSPLAEASEFHVITAFHEHRINAAVSSSRIAQACIVDSLYFMVARRLGGRAKTLAEAAEKSVRKMMRIRPSQKWE